MTPSSPTRTEYLERLRDHLPHRDAARILQDVDMLLEDRIEAERLQEDVSLEEAERRAMAALGPAEDLAEELVTAPVRVDLGTRRAYVRLLAIVFAGHLTLSVVLTAAGSAAAAIPGLLGPLPESPLAAVFSSVLSIFLLDAGVLFLLFALLGRGKQPRLLGELRLHTVATRRDAALALVMLVLLALILHPFRNEVFAVRHEGRLVGFLAPGLVEFLWVVDVALSLFALRQVLILWRGAEGVAAVAADVLGSLVLAAGLALGALQSELVRFPDAALGRTGAEVLEDLVTRIFLVLFLAGALFLVVRFVKRCFRVRQLLVTRSP